MKRFDVLLLENNLDLQTFVANSLIRAGYNTRSVQIVSDAIELLQTCVFHIVIIGRNSVSINDIKRLFSNSSTANKEICLIFIEGFNAYTVSLKDIENEKPLEHNSFHLKYLVNNMDSLYAKLNKDITLDD